MKKITVVLIVLSIIMEMIFPLASLGTDISNNTIVLNQDNTLNEDSSLEKENGVMNETDYIDNADNEENQLKEKQNTTLENDLGSPQDDLLNSNETYNPMDIPLGPVNEEDELIDEGEESEEEKEFDNFEASKMQIVYMSNIEDEGWQKPVTDEETSGTTGQNKSINGLKMKLVNAPENAKVKYKIYDDDGWGNTLYDGELAGNLELKNRIYGIKIELENMDKYSIQYRVHASNYGWLDWTTDGAIAGKTTAKANIEAIEIRIISVVSKDIGVKYRSYVEDYGWQEEAKNGILSGTTGQGKSIYRISIDLDNANVDSKILYQLHIQNHGWTDWYADGEVGYYEKYDLNLEAIRIKIEGLDDYNIVYRTHVQDIGWQPWVKNGELAGTTGKSKRVEAIEIKLTRKQSSQQVSGDFAIQYSSHIQNIGWEKDFSKSNGQLSGTTGKSLRIEAIKIKLANAPENAKISYSAYVEGEGWQEDVYDGNIAGSTGKGLKLLGLKVKLENVTNYSVMYRIHVQDIGWKPWVTDGVITDAIQQKKRIEAIEIKLVPKKEVFAVAYNSHIQNIGWEDDFSKINGDTSGTSGRSLRIEAVKFKLTGNEKGTGIRYRAYIENEGWQSWKSNGSIAGTTGKGRKLLGLKIELINMPTYSIQYRVHIQDYGWSEWQVDGNTLGKISENKRIEAIQARIISKTVSYPQNITYTSKIAGMGWEEEWLHKNGEISGTTGKGLGIYGFKLKLENYGYKQQVEYNLHVQDIGWIGWSSDEYVARADGSRLEAIKIRLKNMDDYTVEYRAHVQDIGWQDWMIDGEVAGTTGQGKRIEAIQIRIVPKYFRSYFGIDVSCWNDYINWQAVKNSGVSFAIIRAGYGQLSSQKDSCFETNYRNARMANIKVGSYLYSYAKSIEDARREAINCLGWLGGREFDLPIFYDLEDKSQSGLGARIITDMAKVFCGIIHDAGYKTGVYANMNWLENMIYVDELPDYCDIWLAHYTGSSSKPSSYSGSYQLWQYSSEGHVDGINGVVDVNIGYKNY